MKVLYFDLETSPCLGWFWRPGHSVSLTYNNVLEDAKIICASWKWRDNDTVYNADWGIEKCDSNVLKPLLKAMKESDIVIAHNGDRFDLPWIRARALVHGIRSLPRWKTLDTLKSVRNNLKLPSNRLGDIARYYGLEDQKIQPAPGLWENIVFGKQERLLEMLEYCDQDVRTLERVHKYIEGVVPHKMHVGVLAGNPKWSCQHCGSLRAVKEKERTTTSGIIKHQMRCSDSDCRKYYTISNKAFIEYCKYRER